MMVVYFRFARMHFGQNPKRNHHHYYYFASFPVSFRHHCYESNPIFLPYLAKLQIPAERCRIKTCICHLSLLLQWTIVLYVRFSKHCIAAVCSIIFTYSFSWTIVKNISSGKIQSWVCKIWSDKQQNKDGSCNWISLLSVQGKTTTFLI